MNQDDANAEQTSKKIRELTKQRDELLAALISLLSLDDDHQRGAGDEDVCLEARMARAAIASVKGGRKV